jgi:hypothetical protein
MMNSKILLTASLAVFLGIFAAPLGAQQIGPVVGISLEKAPGGPVWVKAEIVHADAQSMIVRQRGNELAIYTFTYSDRIKGTMEKISEAGGFQYGDKVKILYNPGQLVALKIHGKPSKPS